MNFKSNISCLDYGFNSTRRLIISSIFCKLLETMMLISFVLCPEYPTVLLRVSTLSSQTAPMVIYHLGPLSRLPALHYLLKLPEICEITFDMIICLAPMVQATIKITISWNKQSKTSNVLSIFYTLSILLCCFIIWFELNTSIGSHWTTSMKQHVGNFQDPSLLYINEITTTIGLEFWKSNSLSKILYSLSNAATYIHTYAGTTCIFNDSIF